jgi:hypothetical protein
MKNGSATSSLTVLVQRLGCVEVCGLKSGL